MKEYFKASELSSFLNISKQAISERAQAEQWRCRVLRGRGKDGTRREYYYGSLPDDCRRKIMARLHDVEDDVLPASTNPDMSRVEADLASWSMASEDKRRIAYQRDYILKRLQDFIQAGGYNQERGKYQFQLAYNARQLKDFDSAVLEEFPLISTRTLEKWRKDRKEHGLPGLLPKWGNRKGIREAVTPECQVFILGQLKDKPLIRHRHVWELVKKKFDPSPSPSSIDRFLKEWKEKHKAKYALMKDPREWKNKFMPAFGDADADVSHFCDLWELDSTKADVVCSDGTRLALVFLIDVYSRRVIIVAAPTSKSTVIAAAIRIALLLWGVPKRIRMDHGADYRSAHIMVIIDRFNIFLMPIPKYAPERKPFGERVIGTFARFEELLPCWLGSNVEQQKAREARETWGEKIMKSGGTVDVPFTPDKFREIIGRFIKKYEGTPHSELNGKTPLQASISSPVHPPRIRDPRVLDVLLATTGNRTVQKKGISDAGEWFHSNDLIPLIGERVEIRRDLDNAGLMYVFDASGEHYLCQVTNEDLQGQALEEYRKAKRDDFKRKKKFIRALPKREQAPHEILHPEVEEGKSKVIPLQQNFENVAVTEAQKAVDDVVPDEVPRRISRAVNHPHSLDELIDGSWLTQEEIDRSVEEAKQQSRNRNRLTQN